MNKKIISLLLAMCIPLSGCSVFMHSAPDRHEWGLKGIEHRDCDFSYYLPAQDTVNAASILFSSIAKGIKSGTENNSSNYYGSNENSSNSSSSYFLVGVLLSAPFVASAIYGFNTAKDCRNFKNYLYFKHSK